ncbi:hypothetical protein EGW08_012413 [Elysia chlorotica]|uniref:Methyltransferase type 12 domain-containing protein n=1 Tax=Elysia chlorotica TaxID=188477 RepID=A0A3S0ZPM1_ELYCH|nr:hypothetical protein EGW08_012413 [Elysia chlorotica]
MTKHLRCLFNRLAFSVKHTVISKPRSTSNKEYQIGKEMSAEQFSKVQESYIPSDRMIVVGPGERNKQPILDVLLKYLPPRDKEGFVLEVASGPGQHVCHFASRCPHITWQPTDLDENYFKSINAHIEHNGLKNVLPPLHVDISKPLSEWATPELTAGSCDLVVNVNMAHISPWKATVGLFKASGEVLKPGGILCMYGPFKVDGVLKPESNVNFDQHLRSQDSSWGIRDTADLDKLAKDNKMRRENMVDMPANNFCAIFRKET